MEAAELVGKWKNENIRKFACLVFKTEVGIASGGYQISEHATPTPEKFTVNIGCRNPKIPIGNLVKVSAGLC